MPEVTHTDARPITRDEFARALAETLDWERIQMHTTSAPALLRMFAGRLGLVLPEDAWPPKGTR